MKCTGRSIDEIPTDYPLKPSGDLPKSVTALRQWLAARSPSRKWNGKVYVASTIESNLKGDPFKQSGCSPNYNAGLWSLACCKHAMRSSNKFRTWILEMKKEPVFIFTLAAKNGIHQALASVAQVTSHFSNMAEYAAWVLKQREEVQSSRLTRARNRNGSCKSVFGDCHADYGGAVGPPLKGHRHYRNASKDRNGKHVILLSHDFLVWDRPTLIWKGTLRQLGYGMDLNNGNIAEHFGRIGNTESLSDQCRSKLGKFTKLPT
jgi:hypothetical protein